MRNFRQIIKKIQFKGALFGGLISNNKISKWVKNGFEFAFGKKLHLF